MLELPGKPERGSFREKQKKAEALLTGLLLYSRDLGADGEALVKLLLSTRNIRQQPKPTSRRALH